jgi:thiosulfate reductase cytochrome b subunit
VGSGLRIFNAYPAFARKGETFCCWPWEGTEVPAWLTFGGWLSGARNWHFAMMWVLALNGAVYLAFIWLHGEWRDLAPRRGDIRDAWEMIRFYLFVRKTHPHQGKHNALQKGVYFALPWLGVLAVLTGLAIWKPVQLAPLTALFGGYAWARYWHFVVMLTLVLLGAGHVFMVFAVDPASLVSMVTGRYDESRSPEALNARPFLRRKPKPAFAIARAAPAPSATTLMPAHPPRPVPIAPEPGPARDPSPAAALPEHGGTSADDASAGPGVAQGAPAGESPPAPKWGTGGLEAILIAEQFRRTGTVPDWAVPLHPSAGSADEPGAAPAARLQDDASAAEVDAGRGEDGDEGGGVAGEPNDEEVGR